MSAFKFSSWCSCAFSRVSPSPHTIMSSTIVRTPLRPAIAPSNHSWHNSGATDTPNGRRFHLNRPMCVANVVSKLDSSSSGMCQYPLVTVIHFYFGGVQFSVKRKFAVSVRRKFRWQLAMGWVGPTGTGCSKI